uniref:Uncharacterized protein n=1 Tax=viral metagenome TaxID=1070528 RepID=A0A6C0HKC6_9ZZZZ
MENLGCSEVLQKGEKYWVDTFSGKEEKMYIGLNNYESSRTNPYQFHNDDTGSINVGKVFKKEGEVYTEISPVQGQSYFIKLDKSMYKLFSIIYPP